MNVLKQYRYIYIFNQTLVHEIGHNLGMPHDFVELGRFFDICRNSFNDSHIPCFKCANFQENRPDQLIGPSTGDPEDCCTGFMHYNDHPHYWSRCSSRFFQRAFVYLNLTRCMESISGQQILHHFLDFVYILMTDMLSPKYFFVIST